MQKFIGISVGDVNGIGVEVILKSLPILLDKSDYQPVIFAHASILEDWSSRLNISGFTFFESNTINSKSGSICCLPPSDSAPTIELGKITATSGAYAMASIKKATEAVLKNDTVAIVTAPISKEAIQKAGFSFPGHTEYLAHLCGEKHEPLMVLATETLRVALNTIHIPVSKVSEAITEVNVTNHVESFYRALQKDFGIQKPKLAVLGLNPHAGDGGVIGKEEQTIISPVIQHFKTKNYAVEGPFPADGFFGSKQWKHFDGILAMYHDQGLIPFKTIAFHDGVNITCNLPIVRTSPDHGTGFSIAGKNIADTSSFVEAYQTAITIIQHRGNFSNKDLLLHETN